MNSRFLKLSALATLLFFTGCSVFQFGGERDAQVIGEVGGEKITYNELKSSFFDAPPSDDMEYDEHAELLGFLDLYMDYRVKVRAAKDAGYFAMEDVLAELEQYENQSVFPYWLEMRFRDELLDELVERSEKELHTSHILITVSEDAMPADTLQAWNRLMEAREKYLSGEHEFDDLMNEYSSRQGGRSVGGDLGYISAGWAIKPFEDVAYNTPAGEISMPFRTSFGYHVIKVHDVRDKKPDKNYSHIYFRTRGSGHSLNQAIEKSQEAYEKLQDGITWDEVTQEFSDDPDSKNRGGDIGWLDPNRFQPNFVAGLEVLEDAGTFTEPFESEYGIHIVRLDSIRTYRDEAHLREELYERLRNLPRYRENRKYTVNKVRRAANDSLYVSAYEEFLSIYESHRDTEFSDLPFTEEFLEQSFYTIDGQIYPVSHYVDFVEERLNHTANNKYNATVLNSYYEKMANKVIIPVTRREFPEFAELSKRYLEGLAVFKITEDSVWTYAMTDTTRLRSIYEENKENYWYDKRYRYYRITADTDSLLTVAKDVINGGVPVDSIRNEVSGLILRTDIINSLRDFPFSHLEGLNEHEFSDFFEFRNRPTMLYLAEIMEPRQMTFDEAFMRVVSDYQPIREREWLDRLHHKYEVTSNRERLRQLIAESD